MKVLVTGSTGFIGSHTIPLLLEQDLEVIATSRDEKKAKQFDWYNQVDYKPCDYQNEKIDFFSFFGEPDVIIHLAWEGLPDYKNPIHMEKNLPANCRFLKNFLENGIKKIVVTGTCYEYGMQCGCLSEDIVTSPVTQYGLAKDTLRKYLELLTPEYNTSFNWVRLFYLYGNDQNPKSVLPLLEKAICQGDKIFNMSGGEQLRDYLPIEDVVRNLYIIAFQRKIDGIINCCSGKPISIRRLLEEKKESLYSDIRLNLGYYQYPDYEPMAFWGNTGKLMKTTNINSKNKPVGR